MYRRFRFEGDIHETLDCIPLTVRRKLDLAALKISLEGWQKLTRPERLALCHLPVDTEEDLAVYREVMRGFAERSAVPLATLPDAEVSAWRGNEIPAQLRMRLSGLGVTLSSAAWSELDEESRYALVKLADPKRHPAKLPKLLAELGLAPEPDEPIRSSRNMCERSPGASA